MRDPKSYFMQNNKPFTVIVGLGKTGFSCLRYLIQREFPVAVIDSREKPPYLAQAREQFPNVNIALGGWDETLIQKAQQLIVSPGVSLKNSAFSKVIHRGIPVIGDIELFAREAKTPMVSITGSNGKTTVTKLFSEMVMNAGLCVNVCGNIGEPVLDQLNFPVPDYYVMELSSFQLETTYSLEAKVAIVLNVSPDHMDRYDTVADYRQAKQRIYANCKQAVINLDEPEIWQSLSLPSSQIGFTMQTPHDQQFGLREQYGQYYLAQGETLLLPTSQMQLQGKHHWQNALACLAMGFSLQLPMASLLKTVANFAGMAHRCQRVAVINRVTWYNDSKATNLGATIAAIDSLSTQVKGRLLLIAGGDAKAADLSPLKDWVARFVSKVYLLGKDAPYLQQLFSDICDVKIVADMAQAVRCAAADAKPDDAVLLSPACSSLDMFENYEQRGRVFMEAVNNL